MARFQLKSGLKREKAIQALMTHRSVEAAARAAGVSKRTLYRYLHEPEFQDACREAKQAVVSQSMARLQFASSAAASTLLKLMVDPSTPASVKARVADSILNHAVKATEMEAVQAPAQTAENDMGSPARRRRIEQGIVLGIAQDMVFCHRERVGNSVDVKAAEPRH
jgi:AcrR family transcriptional regulator